jgi:hypothetical protein
VRLTISFPGLFDPLPKGEQVFFDFENLSSFSLAPFFASDQHLAGIWNDKTRP